MCTIDLLAILQKSLDRALFLYNFIREVRSSGVRGSIAIMHIRKFFKLHHNIVRFRFFPRIAKRSIVIEALTPLDRTSCIKMYKNNARSRIFCRIAKSSIALKPLWPNVALCTQKVIEKQGVPRSHKCLSIKEL